MKNKIKTVAISMNLNQGIIADMEGNNPTVIGAFHKGSKNFYLKEGLTPLDVQLPESLREYEFKTIAGHFEVSYWDFFLSNVTDVK